MTFFPVFFRTKDSGHYKGVKFIRSSLVSVLFVQVLKRWGFTFDYVYTLPRYVQRWLFYRFINKKMTGSRIGFTFLKFCVVLFVNFIDKGFSFLSCVMSLLGLDHSLRQNYLSFSLNSSVESFPLLKRFTVQNDSKIYIDDWGVYQTNQKKFFLRLVNEC